MIFNRRGLPWTVGLSLGWTVVLALFTGGVLVLVLGLYLAYWVRTRQGNSAAFWCWLLLIAAVTASLFSDKHPGLYADVIGAAGSILWLAAPLVLRAEIISLYRRHHGLELPIKPLLTILFSSVYLNYHLLDLPIPSPTTITPGTESAHT